MGRGSESFEHALLKVSALASRPSTETAALEGVHLLLRWGLLPGPHIADEVVGGPA